MTLTFDILTSKVKVNQGWIDQISIRQMRYLSHTLGSTDLARMSSPRTVLERSDRATMRQQYRAVHCMLCYHDGARDKVCYFRPINRCISETTQTRSNNGYGRLKENSIIILCLSEFWRLSQPRRSLEAQQSWKLLRDVSPDGSHVLTTTCLLLYLIRNIVS